MGEKMATKMNGKTVREYLFILNQRLEDHVANEDEWQSEMTKKVDKIVDAIPQISTNKERLDELNKRFWAIILAVIIAAIGAVATVIANKGG